MFESESLAAFMRFEVEGEDIQTILLSCIHKYIKNIILLVKGADTDVRDGEFDMDVITSLQQVCYDTTNTKSIKHGKSMLHKKYPTPKAQRRMSCRGRGAKHPRPLDTLCRYKVSKKHIYRKCPKI